MESKYSTRLCLHNSNMRVEFDDKTSRQSWFRIMPRYKVRSESDNIRMNDQVRISAVL